MEVFSKGSSDGNLRDPDSSHVTDQIGLEGTQVDGMDCQIAHMHDNLVKRGCRAP